METSFDLVGDGDDVDILVEVERLFGIDIGDDEATKIYTFQNLVDLVEAKTNNAGAATCLLAHAFRQVRDSGVGVGKTCRPSSRLDALFALNEGYDPIRKLSDGSGLDLNVTQEFAPVLGISATCWFCAMTFAFVSVSIWFSDFWVISGMSALAIAIGSRWPTQMPSGISTLGDLVRVSFANNYNRLRSRYGEGNIADRRTVVEAICREISGYYGPVTARTTFIANRRLF